MSSNNRLISFIIALYLPLISLFGNDQENSTMETDFMILMALDYQNQKDFLQSAVLFEELFKITKDQIYLKKALQAYFSSKKFKKVMRLAQDNFDLKTQYKEFIFQEYILAAALLKDYEKSLKVSKKLIVLFPTVKNYLIVGDLYYMMGSYQHAKKYYESSYIKDQNIKALISLADLLYNYLDEKKNALAYLETYHRQNGCDKEVCSRLVRYYQEEQNYAQMIAILETMYTKYQHTFSPEKLQKVQNFIVEIYKQLDINKAISFLEKTRGDNKMLLNLYGLTKNYTKALALVRKEYRATQDKRLLGQIAILEFEMAKDKRKVMKHVVANFKLALKVEENANYENYYGYLLIDYDLDIKKGLELVKKALKKQPNNLAFMDSVAWGLYKTNQCKKAFEYMEKVVDQVGLNNEEIRFHFEMIKECNDIR